MGAGDHMQDPDRELAALRSRVGALERELEHQRHEKAELRESEELHRITLSSISDAVFVTDDQGTLTFICPNVDVIFGCTPDEVREHGHISHLLGADLFGPDDLERNGEIRNIEREIVDAAGRGHTLIVNVKRVAIKEGTVLYTCRDITERREAEEAQQAAERRARIAERLASIGTLTAGIAHDVGTPVNIIAGYAKLMEQSLTGETNRERARVIGAQATRITSLIQTLMNLARPRELIRVPIDPAQALDDALSFVRERLARRGVQLRRWFDPVPRVRGDPDRLQQVFLNLFVNAADAMPEGGALEVRLESPDDDTIEIRIRDEGEGIPADALERIFEPFYTTKPAGSGTGLGLLVSRGIVVDHGGEIDVTSEVGKGTEFLIRLPACPPAL